MKDELIAHARDVSNDHQGKGERGFGVPSDLRKSRIEQVMNLLDRQYDTSLYLGFCYAVSLGGHCADEVFSPDLLLFKPLQLD